MKTRSGNIGKIVAVVVCIVCLSTTVAIAYMTSSDAAENTFSVATNKVEIIEEFVSPETIEPGETYMKRVAVKNVGNSSCYVRMMAEFDNAEAASVCSLNLNSTEWSVKQTDGFFYLLKPLSPGEVSEYLFTKVNISSDANLEYISGFDIVVHAESVQAKSPSGDMYSDCWKAFASYTKGDVS